MLHLATNQHGKQVTVSLRNERGDVLVNETVKTLGEMWSR